MKRLLTLLMTLALLIAIHQPVSADCQSIYGGGDGCTGSGLTISKAIQNPTTNAYVHDLGINDTRFHPGDTVTFQITVSNNSNSPMSNVVVTDLLPNYLTQSGNGTAGTIPVATVNLNPGQNQIFTITATLASANNFTSNQVLCLNNQAFAKADNQAQVQDSSQFCVENTPVATATPLPQVPQTVTTPVPSVYPPQPSSQLPSTGPSVFTFLLPLSAGGLGLSLKYVETTYRKKNQKTGGGEV